MDGYEIFAYYQMFINRLPKNIRSNISQKTLYVDSYSYKQSKLRKKFLHTPKEYLKYLEGLIYSRYYKYLSEEENNKFLDQMKEGTLNGDQVRDLIAKNEVLIAEINRKINLYYAINKLHFYEPESGDTLGIQIFEPLMGMKRFRTQEEFLEFKKTMILK